MRATLLIRLHDDAGESAVWCLRSPSGEVGEAATTPLAEALEHCAGRRVVLIVPGMDVLLTETHLPIRQSQKLAQAVPFALEDQLAEDVDNLHFALGARLPEGGVPVAVVARRRMDAWLAPFLENDVRPDALYPDMLCLPDARDGETQTWTALIERGHALLRCGRDRGFACDDNLLDDLLRRASAAELPDLRMYVAADAAAPKDLPGRVEIVPAPDGELTLILEGLTQRPPLNLLQGSYALHGDAAQRWRPWRATAALAAALIVAYLVVQGLTAYQLGQRAAALHSEAAQTFRRSFPDVQRIVDMRTQAERALTRLTRTADGDTGLLFLLARTAQALARTPGLTVDEIEYRDGRVDLSLKGKSLQSLEHLRAHFADQSDLALDVLSANADTSGVQIRISVHPRAAGPA